MNESQVFTKALRLTSPAERSAYLDAACAGDPPLRAAVEALLRVQASDPDFLEQPAATLSGTADGAGADDRPTASADPARAEEPGMVLAGRYKLLEEIGEGGMGTVWMAQQTEPVRRTVAVKLIKPGMDSKAVLARFEAERQALALMDHPNIARVFDAGTAPAGRPFFVMELVKGVPITRYCDDHRLTPRQRLELFVPVCHAIQHAHQKGVIHRDLKPSNVLVALYDDKPVPKVIDFGVAKATGQQLTERTLHTGFGAVVGTVEYMSPEQATFNQLDIDTRSDVYSLGVLLYELLAGSPPFTKRELEQAGMLEMLRVIREEEPSKPSTKLSTADGLPTLAANRGTDPGRLTKLVRGDLDWIVMKALEKDRARRYETANGFALDVQRYLADEPVQARPPSAGYRFRKFLRRNKGRVAAAVALTLSLLAGVTAVWVVQAQAARDRAAAGTDRATREAWTRASVSAACREARERTDEAWAVTDFPDRMQRSTDAALAAIRRADDYAAGGLPSEATLAELESTRRIVDDLARHTRLITYVAASEEQFAIEAGKGKTGASSVHKESLIRSREALRQLDLDPIDGHPDEVARAVATSRIRDVLLGVLLEWYDKAFHYTEVLQHDPTRADLPADASVVRDRLARVIRSARRLCGGAHARWQELLDRNDVPGLVAFSASPEALSFGSFLVRRLGHNLFMAREYAACRAYLRAAVERYPHDGWLHFDLAHTCAGLRPPEWAEALRHSSAACALWPKSAWFHLMLGLGYAELGATEQAIATFRKAMAMQPAFTLHANYQMGMALVKAKDWEGAIPPLREAIRLIRKGSIFDVWLPSAHQSLGKALSHTGRPREALQVTLAALQQNPAWANGPHPAWVYNARNYLRYDAACYALNCANGKGADAPSPAERPAHREQALKLLTAELAAVQKLAPARRDLAHRRMTDWLADEDLANVRDPKALQQLTPDERDAWKKLWDEVRALRDRTAPPPGSPPTKK